jgi:hypothetical protein
MEAYIVAAFSSICIRYSAHSDWSPTENNKRQSL